MIGLFQWLFSKLIRKDFLVLIANQKIQRDNTERIMVNIQTLLQMLKEKRVIDCKEYDYKFNKNYSEFKRVQKANSEKQK